MVEHVGDDIWIDRENKTIHLGHPDTPRKEMTTQDWVRFFALLAEVWEEDEKLDLDSGVDF